MEEFAAKVQQLVRHARQALAEGDMERAVRDLKEIESDAGNWKDALRARREAAKDGLPTSPTHSPGSVPPPGVDQAVPRPGPASSSLPGSAERRLDELERKVERLVRALEREGREPPERLAPLDLRARPGFPAPPIVEGIVRKVNDRDRRVEIDIGSDDGLIAGHELVVYRSDRPRQTTWEVEFLGRIRVLGTNPDQSDAKVIELFEGKKIKEGDRVSTRSPSDPADNTTSGALQKK